VVLGGALDGPQIAAIALVLAGAFVLMERKRSDGVPLFSQDLREAGRSTSHLSAEPTVGNIGEDPRKP
jgi:hypothetical protein